MGRTAAKKKITLEALQKEVNSLKKKLFVYETQQAAQEVKMKKTKGPFKSGKEVLDYIEN